VVQVLSGVPSQRGGVPEPDDIALETCRGHLLVRFTGEIDTALRSRFNHVLEVVRVAHEPVVVDCREVTFFCAEGVRMLLLLQRTAGGPGVLEFRGSWSVDRALRLSGIDRYPFLD
jgi:anti-anti-sigma regulatory factor